MLKKKSSSAPAVCISKGLHFFGSKYLCQSDKAAYTFSEKKNHIYLYIQNVTSLTYNKKPIHMEPIHLRLIIPVFYFKQ